MQTDTAVREVSEGYLLELRPKKVEAGPIAEPLAIEYQTLARTLGFKALADDMERAPDEVAAWCERHGLEPLSKDDYATWRAYLPTPYWSDPEQRINPFEDRFDGAIRHPRSFADYRFHEGVPLNVLHRMEALRGKFVYEVRTPETNLSPDPVWFGHLIWPDGTRKIYLLGRWGRDSDPHYLPGIEEVRAIVGARLAGVNAAGIAAFCFIAFTLSLAIWASIQIGGFSPMVVGIVALCLGLMVGADTVGPVISRWASRRRIMRTSPQSLPFIV